MCVCVCVCVCEFIYPNDIYTIYINKCRNIEIFIIAEALAQTFTQTHTHAHIYIFIYIYIYISQLAEVVEYAYCISEKCKNTLNEFPGYDTK